MNVRSFRWPAISLGTSVAFHLVLAGLTLAFSPRAAQRVPTIVEMRLVEQPRPRPPAPPPAPPEEQMAARQPEPVAPPPPPRPKATPRMRPRPKAMASAPKPAAEPPLPQAPRPPSPVPPAGGFSIDLEATVQGGSGIAVIATEDGGNMYADPNRRDLAPGRPAEGPPAELPGPVLQAFEVETLPSCPALQPPYPDEARRLELEAEVVLRLRIGADGKVEQARVKRKGGEGFDEAALVAARALRCTPARKGGQAVSTWIDYEIAFRLVS